MRWALKEKTIHNKLPVYEVKCPVCGHKETYHIEAPEKCFVCETELESPEV